jgi:hypothetical protein
MNWLSRRRGRWFEDVMDVSAQVDGTQPMRTKARGSDPPRTANATKQAFNCSPSMGPDGREIGSTLPLLQI